jgi:3-methyladenine DNA glycosylase/8-oxoguanine DNA glycosylase
VEAKRAEALRTVARHAMRVSEWSSLPPRDAAAKLSLLRGIGVWTIGSALGPALGDPDAVPVGDYHIPNMVSWALAGEPRGTDERMLDLLAPYAGQRGRVISLLARNGNAAPKFGPRQRIQPMYRY